MSSENYPSEQLFRAVEAIAAIQEKLSPKDLLLLSKKDLHIRSSVLTSDTTEYVVWGTVVEYLIFVKKRDGSRVVKKYVKAQWEDKIYEMLSFCTGQGPTHRQVPSTADRTLINKRQIEKPPIENTSGHGKGAAIPPEIRGWNWGAFSLSLIWGLSHRVWITLIGFIPPLQFVMPFVLGAKGNEWAWQNQKWHSVEHFRRTQRNWALAGLVYWACVAALCGLAYFASIEWESPFSAQDTSSTPEPPATVLDDTPSRIFTLTDMAQDSQYWNSNWDATSLYHQLIAINKAYHKEHPYVEGILDCDDMAMDIWNILDKRGITSAIVVGNLDIDKERFTETDHAWLIVLHNKDNGFQLFIFIVEPTNGETYAFDKESMAHAQYLQGYFFASPSDLRGD